MTQFWAIRHTPTGFWLPWPNRRRDRRPDGWGPAHVQVWFDTAPRLFFHRASAENVLREWLRFDGYSAFERNPKFKGGWRGYFAEGPRSDVAHEYEVVPVQFTVIEEIVE